MLKKYLMFLGYEVHDPVSQITGIVSSICFDISGCIQACVRQPARDGKIGESYWIDLKQLSVLSGKPVCPVTDFENIISGAENGSQSKPGALSLPSK